MIATSNAFLEAYISLKDADGELQPEAVRNEAQRVLLTHERALASYDGNGLLAEGRATARMLRETHEHADGEEALRVQMQQLRERLEEALKGRLDRRPHGNAAAERKNGTQTA